MSREPVRLRDSANADELTRGLVRAGQRSASLPPAARLRGERRVARLAAAPAVALGVGLWSKVVAAAFGASFASALALVSVSPTRQQRLGRSAAAGARVATAPRHPANGSRPPAASAEAAAEPPPGAPAATASSSEGPPSSAVATHVATSRVAKARSAGAGSAPLSPITAGSAASPLSFADLGESSAAPSSSSPQSVAPSDPMAAELELLSRARVAVTSDPDLALALLNQHARALPHASLALEREVLVIEALRHSGRAPEAAIRGRELLAAAPSALYAERLKRLLRDQR